MILVQRAKKAEKVILALRVNRGRWVIPVFRVLLVLRVMQEAREFKVKLVHVEILVKKVTLVLAAKEEKRVTLV